MAVTVSGEDSLSKLGEIVDVVEAAAELAERVVVGIGEEVLGTFVPGLIAVVARIAAAIGNDCGAGSGWPAFFK